MTELSVPTEVTSDRDDAEESVGRIEEIERRNEYSKSNPMEGGKQPCRVLKFTTEQHIQPVPSNDEEFRSFIEQGPNQPRGCFPKTKSAGCNRSFDKKWYEAYPWLEYSYAVDGVFCHTCRAFGTSVAFSKGTVDPAFIEHGCRNWQKLKTKLANHHKSDYHTQANGRLSMYLKSRPIDAILSVARAENLRRKEAERAQNREVVTRLIRIVQILGIAGAPLRGHYEGDNDVYRGLFKELYNLLADFDAVLGKHRESADGNALYTSKTIQNEIIQSVYDVMTDEMCRDFEKTKHIAVMVDETTDCSNHEQIAILIRWADEDLRVHETLIAVRRAISTKAEDLLDILLDALKSKRLLDKVIAQCYDGGSNMQGHLNGLQAKLSQACGKNILTVHCYAHCLNLVLVDSMKNVKEAFSFFGILEALYVFIEGSAQRHGIFEQIAKSMDCKLKKLKKLSETRWACRAEAVNAIADNVHVVIKTLEELEDTAEQAKIAAQSKGLLSTVQSFDFILWIRLLQPVLNSILTVSAMFQKNDLDIDSALRAVDVLEATIKEFRDSDNFNHTYEECEHECAKNGIYVANKRRRRINVRLDDHPENEHFSARKDESRKAYFEVLDSIITGLEERFSQVSRSTLLAFQEVFTAPKPSEEKIRKIALFCNEEYSTLSGEIKLLRNDPSFGQARKFPILLECLKSASTAELYPTIKSIVSSFLAIPVSTASVERTFSKLALVKTKIRSTMSQERLETLIHMCIEQKRCKNINIDKCIDKFKSYGPRRLLL